MNRREEIQSRLAALADQLGWIANKIVSLRGHRPQEILAYTQDALCISDEGETLLNELQRLEARWMEEEQVGFLLGQMLQRERAEWGFTPVVGYA